MKRAIVDLLQAIACSFSAAFIVAFYAGGAGLNIDRSFMFGSAVEWMWADTLYVALWVGAMICSSLKRENRGRAVHMAP